MNLFASSCLCNQTALFHICITISSSCYFYFFFFFIYISAMSLLSSQSLHLSTPPLNTPNTKHPHPHRMLIPFLLSSPPLSSSLLPLHSLIPFSIPRCHLINLSPLLPHSSFPSTLQLYQDLSVKVLHGYLH